MKKIKILNIGIKNNKFGNNVTIIKPVNIYGSVIDDNVFIGPFVEVQKKCKIGKNTKIQSHSFICELVTIGKNCFIGHGVNFINDRFKNHKPAMGNKFLWEETYVGDNVYIGSSSVTTSNGLKLQKQQHVDIDLGQNDAIYAVASATGPYTITWLVEN